MEDKKFKDDPFEEAELELGIKLPIWLKNIFVANGYDDKIIVGKIEEEDIKSTEDFAINTLPYIIEENEKKDYYGIFKNHISNFKILDGYKKKLWMIINFYKLKNDRSQVAKQKDEQKDKRSFSEDSTGVRKKKKTRV